MAGKGISGEYGDVKIDPGSGYVQIAEVGKWDFGSKSKVSQYVSNKTSQFTRTVAGPLSASGTLTGFHDPTAPATAVIESGTAALLKLYLDATAFYIVAAIIGDFKISVDISEGSVIGWTASFDANGSWTNPVAEGAMRSGVKPSGDIRETGKFLGFEAPLVREVDPRKIAATQAKQREVLSLADRVERLGKNVKAMGLDEFQEFAAWLEKRRAA